jgi:uncharacterized protein YggE
MHRTLLAVTALAAGALLATACAAGAHPKRAASAAAASASATASPAATSPTAPPPAKPTNRTITATGDGEATGTPDTLTVEVGVQTTDASAAQALQTNNAEAAALIAKLEADGVATTDIQTSQLNISPNYTGTATPRITGYTVTDEVVAKFGQLDRAGQLIDDAVAAAGNDARVDSIGYSIDDDGPLLAAARADAVRSAAARAEAMAAAAGVTLGEVQTITDETQPQTTYPEFAANSSAGGVGSPAIPVPLQAGQEQLSAEVSVVYEIAGS